MANSTTSSPGGDGSRKAAGSLPIPSSRRGIKGFFNEVNREMRKVSWPSVHETNRLTGVVLALCVAMAAILTGMGYFFDTLVRLITKGTI
jgi:preprotein translocase SecE subunit